MDRRHAQDDRRSLWVQGRADDRTPLEDDVDTEVVIIGAGITGLTAAYELSRGGRQVLLLESRQVGSGASGHTTGKVTSLQGTTYRTLTRRHGPDVAAAYAAGSEAAREWMLARIGEMDVVCGVEERPAATYTRTARLRATIIEEHAAAAAAGLPVRLESALDLPFDVDAAVVLEAGQFQFDPVPYLEALADAVVEAGGAVHEHSRAVGLQVEKGRPVAVTDRARVRARQVLVCTATPFLDRALFFAKLEPLRSYVVAVEVDRPLPRSMSISIDEPVRSLRTAPDPHGTELLLVGGAGHPVGRGGDTRRCEAELLRWVDENVGAATFRGGWSAQDYATLDGLPYVGTAFGLPESVAVATGYAKWGMTTGTMAGRVLADRVLDREPARWAPMLDAGRVDLTRSVRRFVALNAEVAARMVAGHATSLLGRSPAGRREGTVVRGTANAKVDGRACAVSGICPHLGGVVAWNPLERSWDCPLHGSRFGADGRLLQGPAVNDLEHR